MTSTAGKPGPSAQDVASLFRRIADTWPAGYTDRQAFEDFNALFLGSELGQRVLYRIFESCRLFSTPLEFVGDGQVLSTELTFANIGRGDMARFILNVLLNEPPTTPPASAVTEDPSTKET